MATVKAGAVGPRDFFYKSADGLDLYAADYGDPDSAALPVICLAGLTRNTRDFHDLAVHLAGHPDHPRRVVAFDYRGRGRSAYDPNPDNYNPLVELNDVMDGMRALGIARAVIFGTSRGGIIAMLMGARHAEAVAGVVLNDIGPVLRSEGRDRIGTTMTVRPEPAGWAEAVAFLREQRKAIFPAFSDADWESFARATFEDGGNGRLRVAFDAGLARNFAAAAANARPMWKHFDTLASVPVMVIRGGLSDLLTEEIVDEMAAHHPALVGITVPDEGHTPLLRGPILGRIADFVARAG